MINYLQSEGRIDVPAPYAVASGGGMKIGALFGVAQTAAATGQSVTMVREGVYLLPGVAAEAAAAGDRAYWDDTARVITKASGTATMLVGAFVAPKAAGGTACTVLLDGVIR